jgi:SH3 domain protein
MSMAMRTRAWLALIWLGTFTLAVSAETVYVSDRFEIGVHESTDIDSVIVAVIPSGTPLEVAGRNGEFVQVTTPDGIKGWVDGRYLVGERPSGGGAVADYDAKLEEATRALGAARAEVEVLRERVKELQRDAATASDASRGFARITKPATKPASAATNEDSAMLENANREIEKLARENRQLKGDVEELKAVQIAAAQSVAESAGAENEAMSAKIWRGPVTEEAKSWTPWQWLLFGSILLLAFAAGGYAVDWDSRRRHGGFRI